MLSNTFVVTSANVYYIAIRGTGSNTASSQYLQWDDLVITAPCHLPGNSPTVSVSANTKTLCPGNTITLTASGAASYTFSTDSNPNVSNSYTTVIAPPTNTTYSLTGVDTISGCLAETVINIVVDGVILVVAPIPKICVGSTAILSVPFYTGTINWSNSQTSASITVSPTVTTLYTASMTTSMGCKINRVFTVTVIQPPLIDITASSTVICINESVILTASGGILIHLDFWC